MTNNYVYDKAKYHAESVEELGLPEEHAANHTVFFLRWLIENNLMSDWVNADFPDAAERVKSGELSPHDVYAWCDHVLMSEMLSDDGNAFAMAYFDFDRGEYLSDYKSVLQKSRPSEFHVAYTEENYQTLRAVIDERYAKWRKGKSSWWRFW